MTTEIVLFIVLGLVGLYYAAVACYFRKTRYREYLFKPVGANELDPATAEYLGLMTREMLRLEFELIGDYILSERAPRHVARYFVGRDRNVFASINDYDGTPSCELCSVFDNGACLLSSQAPCRKFRYNPDDLLIFNHLPGTSLAELDSSHREKAEEYDATFGSKLLGFAPADFRKVDEYVHRLMYWDLYNRGLIPSPPPSRSDAARARN